MTRIKFLIVFLIVIKSIEEKMEFYKTIRNIASTGAKIAIVTALPYICNDGCAYSGSKASAAEVRQEVRAPVIKSKNLEIILEK